MTHNTLKLTHHGRETYAVYYGADFVLKRPLPTMGAQECANWLKKQHKTNIQYRIKIYP